MFVCGRASLCHKPCHVIDENIKYTSTELGASLNAH